MSIPCRSPVLLSIFLITGCAGMPTGPSVLVLPGANRDFGSFTQDDARCRQYALTQTGGKTPNTSAAETGIASAAVGTAVGAAAGAAFGGAPGAAIGAGAGLIGGSTVGAGLGYQAGYALQQRYDHAYIQCMYGHGHQVPVNGVIASPQPAYPIQNRASQNLPLPPSGPLPLPPAGSQGPLSSGGGSNGRLSLPPPP